ncbi:hydrogenase nickel incorporation protein HypB [Leptothrix discophora]|uniref:Hydrogenase maturation factor HypB n=1 Tax=Leptothrix discophora TaxID=89 RepID=A0ABT9G1C2_LEPDI|nr:hydrogenase nickel incorporation protein HypB [Leptothrix discophora]MDP4300289.1 hydrogenase nickel incorporation protein HypB [Leptothrix discophora]
MCVVCGCAGLTRGEQPAVAANGDLHFGAGAARVSVPGMSMSRTIALEVDVLGENQRQANANRAHFAAHGVRALNLVSSPGSGKTTLLCATIAALRQRAPQRTLAVIEGDQQTAHDADRIRATGVPAIQVNTGKGCHLDAPMVSAAFARLHGHEHHQHPHDHVHAPADQAGSLLFIENVGNLVCPAMWDLGEAAKVAILSVTEGEDKPLKYPDLFAAASLMVINKVDLLPHLDFDVAACIAAARQVNPAIEVLLVSATTGQGLDAWLDWLLDEDVDSAAPTPSMHPATATPPHPRSDSPTARLARIAVLEAELAALRAGLA